MMIEITIWAELAHYPTDYQIDDLKEAVINEFSLPAYYQPEIVWEESE